MIKLIYHIPILCLFLILRLILIVLGWVMVPFALILNQRQQITSRVHYPRVISTFKGIFWLWGNDEDGVMAAHEFQTYPGWFRIIYWCAFRNPVNNLRFVPWVSCHIQPDKIKFIGSRPGRMGYDNQTPESEWFYCYQGLYSNIWIQFKMFGSVWRFWTGWKIFPKDQLGLDTSSYRRHGAGFATQFKRLR